MFTFSITYANHIKIKETDVFSPPVDSVIRYRNA